MRPNRQTFALVVADIVGSSSLFEVHGPVVADRHRREVFEALRRGLGDAGGNEIRNTGDGLVLAFPSFTRAARHCIRATRALAELDRAGTGGPAHLVKLGIHVGEATDDAELAPAILVADALCAAAAEARILVSGTMASLAGPDMLALLSPGPPLDVPGRGEPLSTYALDWRTGDPDALDPIAGSSIRVAANVAMVAPQDPLLAGEPERLAELRVAFLRLLRDALDSHDGQEVKETDSGLVAVFRTVSDAVAWLHDRRLATERWSRARPESAFALKAGLAVGEPTADGKDWFGFTMVLAARLQARALPGDVYAGKAVRELCRPGLVLSFGDVGGLQLKGIQRPVPTFRLVFAPGEEEPPPLPAPMQAPAWPRFVGRDAELAALATAMDGARKVRPHLVLVTGEPGSGRSRLCGEFARAQREGGVRVLLGGAALESRAHQVFADALEHLAGTLPQEELQACFAAWQALVEDLAPVLRRRLPGGPPADATAPVSLVHDAVCRVFVEAASRCPIVLLLEDLELADVGSVALLRQLIRTQAKVPLLVVGSLDPRELRAAGPLAMLLAEAGRDPRVSRIDLGGLDDRGVDALIRAVHATDFTASFVSALRVHTGGNPHFLVEILRQSGQGALAGQDGRWTPRIDFGDAGLPHAVADVLQQRIARLGHTGVLHAAAVLGQRFRAADVAALLDDSVGSPDEAAGPLAETLARAEALDLVHPSRTEVEALEFASPLLRDLLLADCPVEQRRRWHLQRARLLRERGGDGAAHLAEVAGHLVRALPLVDAAEAVDAAMVAARRAVGEHAWQTAVRLYESALGACGTEVPRRPAVELDAALELGQTLWRAGDVVAARERFVAAAELARALGDAAGLARAALGYTGGARTFLIGVFDPQAVRLLEEALSANGDAAPTTRAALLGRLGAAMTFSDAPSAAAPLVRQGLQMPGVRDDVTLYAELVHALRLTLSAPDNLGERLATSAEIVRAARRAGARDVELDGHNWRFGDLLEAGDIADARDAVDAFARLAEASGLPVPIATVRRDQVVFMLAEGRFREAGEIALPGARADQNLEVEALAQAFRAQLFQVLREAGRLADIEPALRLSVARYPRLISWRPALTLVCAETGRQDEARAQLAELAHGGFASLPWGIYWTSCVVLLAEVCGVLDEEKHARALYDRFRPVAPPFACTASTVFWGSTARVLGRLARVGKLYDAAEEHLRVAEIDNGRIGARAHLVRTRLEQALLLLDRGAPGPAVAAKLDQVEESAGLIGMVAVSAQAKALRRRLL